MAVPVPASASALPAPAHGAINASPLARRLAAELGVELESIAGSGPYARILKRDVAGAPRAVNGRRAAPRPVPTDDVHPITRSTIFVEGEAWFDRALELREQLRTSLTPVPTLDDIVVKAVGLALREHPRFNSSWDNGEIVVHERIDVAIAIAVADELIMPTITGADTLSLPAIAQRSEELAGRAANGKLQAADLEPATFSVTNLGRFGTTRFTPVLASSQAAGLGVGALHPSRERDGTPALAASLTVVCDARIAHPAHAAMFLESLTALLQAPMRLLLR
jgi:pyruvate dehydrogenase E2 component (dihydrolipoamide acetyltransferase)